jgi:hypothetical protein
LTTELTAQRLYNYAKCGGRYTLFESTDPLDYLEAEGYCLQCPVRAECLEVVAPTTSWYDGTCAGKFYVDGEEITSYDGKVTHDFSHMTTEQLENRYAELYAIYEDEGNRHSRVKLAHELLAIGRELKIKGTL